MDERIEKLAEQSAWAKRSLAEIDDIIEEIIQRNPDFVDEIGKIIEASKGEQK